MPLRDVLCEFRARTFVHILDDHTLPALLLLAHTIRVARISMDMRTLLALHKVRLNNLDYAFNESRQQTSTCDSGPLAS